MVAVDTTVSFTDFHIIEAVGQIKIIIDYSKGDRVNNFETNILNSPELQKSCIA